MKKIALIPARSGSKRLKNKNILNLGNRPLLYYSIKSAQESNLFNKIIVVTDSKKYEEIAKKYGAEVPALRPSYTAKDNSPDLKWIKWILNKIKVRDEKDVFFILRPTSPFRNKKTIIAAWKKFNSLKHKCDSLRAVELCDQHPGKMWKEKGNFIEPIINKKIKNTPMHSNQYAALPKIFVQNASLEISYVKNIFKKNSISGNKIIPFFTKNYEGFDINNHNDYELAKILLKKKKLIR